MRRGRIRDAVRICAFLFAGSAACEAQLSGQARGKEPVAEVLGQTIYADDLMPLIQAQLFQLHLQEYEVKSRALEDLVNQKLLEAEARKRGVFVEKLLAQEVDGKVAEPTEPELQALYIVQKEQLRRSFDELKPQLQKLLKQSKLREAREDYCRRLRERAGVSTFLQKPQVDVASDPKRLLGSVDAPVVIVEFSNFLCKSCRSVQPFLKNLLVKYAGRLSLVFRDYPSRDNQFQTQLAAEASRCAGEQDRFWAYHDFLFENPDKLNQEGLVEQARALKLDEKQFESCLSGGKYRPQIEQDRQMGLSAGIIAAPGFLVNGNLLAGDLTEAALERAVQAELAAAGGRPSAR